MSTITAQTTNPGPLHRSRVTVAAVAFALGGALGVGGALLATAGDAAAPERATVQEISDDERAPAVARVTPSPDALEHNASHDESVRLGLPLSADATEHWLNAAGRGHRSCPRYPADAAERCRTIQ